MRKQREQWSLIPDNINFEGRADRPRDHQIMTYTGDIVLAKIKAS